MFDSCLLLFFLGFFHPSLRPPSLLPQAISVMEVPVVKIREDEAGGEEKSVIKSIVNMVQYGSSSVCPPVCLSVCLEVGEAGG